MKRLSSYTKSKIYNVTVIYNGEKVKFNLAAELKINRNQIDDELKKQATHYGFCLLVHKGLLTKFEELKLERERVYGKLWRMAKDKKVNGRFMSDDTAKWWVRSHKQFIKATQNCIKAKDDADKIYSCLKAFEQRKDLLQSISSNQRAEKNS